MNLWELTKNLMKNTCTSDGGSEVPAGQQCPQSCVKWESVRAKWYSKEQTGSRKQKVDPTSVSQYLQTWDVDDLKKGLIPFSMVLHTHLAQEAKKLKEDLRGSCRAAGQWWPNTHTRGQQISNNAQHWRSPRPSEHSRCCFRCAFQTLPGQS